MCSGPGPGSLQPVELPPMKRLFPIFVLLAVSVACPGQVPKIFAGLLAKDALVKGEVVVVLPPPEMDKYVAKVETAAKKDPDWFVKYSKDAKPGVPLPYHEKLGLTKEEYDQYSKLWAAREFRPLAQVVLQLRENKGGEWMVSATGEGNVVSTLRYLPKDDVFQSPNGKLARIEDIDADPQSILGAWKAGEWKFQETNELGTSKENFAVGRTTDGKYGLLVYRMQEVSTQGTSLCDKSLVIRYPLGAAGKMDLPTVKVPPGKSDTPGKKSTPGKGDTPGKKGTSAKDAGGKGH